MRPSGPLPPRVYWTRRLLALVVLLVVISILWWCVQKVTGNADDSAATAGDGTSQQADSSDAGPSEGEEPSGGPAGDETIAPPSTEKQKPRKHKKKNAPLMTPTGGCDVAEVAMSIEVADVDQGKANPITLELTGPQGTACTQAITSSTLVLRITSGDDVVWSSDDCPDKLLAEEVVVRAKPAGKYTFTWNGQRSTGSCANTGPDAKPGGYWVEAALIGADAHKAFFDVKV